MAATDQQIANAARDSLKRILDTDMSSMSEDRRQLQQLEIDRLEGIISKFEAKANRSSRRICHPVTRVNI